MPEPNPLASSREDPVTSARRLLFVCTGNTCRSPMAEHLFRARMPADAGWVVESAGLCAASGAPASPGARAALRQIGLDADRHRSQPVSTELVDRSDLIVVMTRSHRTEIERRFSTRVNRVRLLSSFSPGGKEADIADPIGLSVEGYGRSLHQIGHAVSDLILFLVQPTNERTSTREGDPS